MCENNNCYSEIAEAYRNYRDSFYNDTRFSNNECNCNRDNDIYNRRRPCCGRRFDSTPMDPSSERALRSFENQLRNTNNAINCLNKCFNNLEDTLYDNRCCLSNRVKNILRSMQNDICDLQDTVRDIADDTNCLRQSL